jgi:hypothetical protein
MKISSCVVSDYRSLLKKNECVVIYFVVSVVKLVFDEDYTT